LVSAPTSARTRVGSSGAAAPDHRPQTANAKAKAPPLGSVFLGDVEEGLVQVGNSIDDFPARDCHRLAASRIQDVLAMEVAPLALCMAN